MSRYSPLSEILNVFGASPAHIATAPIKKESVIRWMQAEDIEALGALNAFFLEGENYRRITPPLTAEEYLPFVKRYVERCFRENPDGEWSDSRYSAGQALTSWFIGFWNDAKVPRHVASDLKDWLAGLYKTSEEELRTCIVHSTLEHLFENPEIMRFFSDWERDSFLRKAHDQARAWAEKHQDR